MKTVSAVAAGSRAQLRRSALHAKLAALLAVAALAAVPACAHAATPGLSNSGQEFWLGFTSNLGSPALTLYITGATATTGTVEIKGESFSEAFSVTPGTVTAVKLPAEDAMATSDGIEEKAIHVSAGAPVVVYGLNDIPFTTDAYTALPDEVDGTEYTVLAFGSGLGGNSELGVVATKNGTEVTITPSVNGGAGDSRPAGVPYTITLNQGQEYELQATSNPEDLTGTKITATAPVSVFGGEQCANIPNNDYVACDYIVEQNAPDDAWGTSFLTVPLKTRHNGDYFELVADQNNTEVKLNGSVVATLNAGEHYSQEVEVASEWSSSKPIELGQYSNSSEWDDTTGDPSMTIIPPYQQFETAYTVTTPVGSVTEFANYINLVVPKSAVGTVAIDGTPVPESEYSAIGSSEFEGAQVDVAPGTHVITGNGQPFGAFMYGFSEFNAYSYYGGMSLAPVAEVTKVTLTPATETAIVNTERCVTATVTDQEGNPLGGVRVDFKVTGANTTSGSVFANGSGEATFCYTGVNVGEDTIVGAVGTISGNATKTWSPVPNAGVALSPPSGTSVIGEPHTLTATVVGENGEPLAGVPVEFAISSGPNEGTMGEAETNTEGQATYTYTSSKVGTDEIVADYVSYPDEDTPSDGAHHDLELVPRFFESNVVTETWTELIKSETKEETKSETPATTTTTTPAAPTPTPPAKAGVLAFGTAHLASSARACTAGSIYDASVSGSDIASVTYVLNGHKLKTLTKASHGKYALAVPVKAGKVEHLAIHVTFTSATSNRTETINKTIARCAAVHHVSTPRFTG